MEELKVGSVVRLNSGGPEMTISYLERNEQGADRAGCYWIFREELVQSFEFLVPMLTIVK
jgi:uncharacterized protein YodC (DUF2158 family)